MDLKLTVILLSSKAVKRFEGDVVKQDKLADTLKKIRDKGPDYFYEDVGKVYLNS